MNIHLLYRHSVRLLLLMALLGALGGGPTGAAHQTRVWHVAPNGSDSGGCGGVDAPCRHIATAITNALPQDTVLLAAGVYSETLEITKTLTLASRQPELTVIDGGGADSVIRIMAVTTALTVTGLTIQNGRAPYGGGIDNFSGGTVRVINSTIMSNTATGAAGGGIFNYGDLELVNSTLTANSAAAGGGVATNFGRLLVANSTIVGNAATGEDERGGGGIFAGNGGALAQNSIVAGNKATSGPDCAGPLDSRGYNLVGSGAGCAFSGATGDRVGTAARPLDPQLGPLRRYGGPTPTFTLRAGSPAIDGGNPAAPGSGAAACAVADQRGIPRPLVVGGSGTPRCDIGAYEYDAPIVLPWLYLPSVMVQ